MATRPAERTGRLVLVHLSEVPETRRVAAADRMIKKDGLVGTAAIQIKMAAVMPMQDPAIWVDETVARRVLR